MGFLWGESRVCCSRVRYCCWGGPSASGINGGGGIIDRKDCRKLVHGKGSRNTAGLPLRYLLCKSQWHTAVVPGMLCFSLLPPLAVLSLPLSATPGLYSFRCAVLSAVEKVPIHPIISVWK